MNPANRSNPSRDPRLNSNIPSSTHTRAQPNKPPATTDHDAFLNSISDLIKNAVETSVLQAENDRLQKSKESIKDLMQRAQSQKYFQSTAAFYENATKEQDADLRRTEEALKKNKLQCQEIEKGLRSKWSLGSGSPAIESRLKRLEDEVQAAKAAATQANNETSKVKLLNQDLETKLEQVQEKLSQVQQDFGQDSTKVARLYKTVESMENLAKSSAPTDTAQLQQQLDEVQRVSAENANSVRSLRDTNTDHTQRLDNFESSTRTGISQMYETIQNNLLTNLGPQLQTLETKVGNVFKDHNDLATEVKTMGVSVQDHTLKLNQSNLETAVKLYNNWQSLEPRLKKLEATLARMKSNPTPAVTGTPLSSENSKEQPDRPKSSISQASGGASVSQVTHAVDHATFDEFIRIQKMKDDMLSVQVENLKENAEENFEKIQKQLDGTQADHKKLSSEVAAVDLTKLVQHIGGIQADYAKISESVKNIENQALLHQLWASLDHVSQRLGTVEIAIHSLEMRYNGLNAEPVVKSMIVAMEEMYPSAGQLIEETKKLRERVEKDVPALEQKIEHLTTAHEIHKNQSEAITGHCLDNSETVKLKEHVEQEIPVLQEKIQHLTQSHESHKQAILLLKQHIQQLEQAHGCHEKEIPPLKQRVEELTQTQNSHQKELPTLTQKIEQLTQDHGRHKKDIPPLKQEIEHLAQVHGSHQKQLSSLREKIEQFKKPADELAEIGSINQANSETIKSYGADFETLTAKFTHLEVDINTKLQNLLDFVDKQLNESQPRPEGTAVTTSNGNSTVKQESPPTTAAGPGMTEDTSSLLPKTKKKKKRPRPSSLHDDERQSLAPVSSPNLPSSPQPTTQDTSSAEPKRPKKKKRKQSNIDSPILLE